MPRSEVNPDECVNVRKATYLLAFNMFFIIKSGQKGNVLHHITKTLFEKTIGVPSPRETEVKRQHQQVGTSKLRN
jgi:hypothetical protein